LAQVTHRGHGKSAPQRRRTAATIKGGQKVDAVVRISF